MHDGGAGFWPEFGSKLRIGDQPSIMMKNLTWASGRRIELYPVGTDGLVGRTVSPENLNQTQTQTLGIRIAQCRQYLQTLGPNVGITWTPKVCRIMAFWAIIMGLGLLFYILLGFRYLNTWIPRDMHRTRSSPAWMAGASIMLQHSSRMARPRRRFPKGSCRYMVYT